MKRLSKQQAAQHAKLATDLTEARDSLNQAIREYNRRVKDLHASLLMYRVAKVNTAAKACNAFVSDVHDEQESYYEDRSDNWREGDAGSAYEEWKNSWEVNLDELELEDPQPFDEVDIDVDEFANLEEECPS